MPAVDDFVRDHVVQEMRQEIRLLILDGCSPDEIAEHLDGRRTLTEAERGLIELLAYHVAAEVKGRY
jgi:hypothetical protein